MFYIGQKVVCVDLSAKPFLDRIKPAWKSAGQFYLKQNGSGLDGLNLNEVYTIKSIIPVSENHIFYENLGLTFHEIETNQTGFVSTRFRPLIKKKTDITIFTNMLKQKELVDHD